MQMSTENIMIHSALYFDNNPIVCNHILNETFSVPFHLDIFRQNPSCLHAACATSNFHKAVLPFTNNVFSANNSITAMYPSLQENYLKMYQKLHKAAVSRQNGWKHNKSTALSMEYAEIVEDNAEDIINLVLEAYNEYSTCVIKTLNKIFNKMDQNSYLSLSMLTTLCCLAGFKLEKVSPRVGVEAAKEKVIKNANINTNIYQFLQLFFTNLLSIKNSEHLATVIEKYYGLYHYLPNKTFISLCRSVMSISSMMGFEKKKSVL